MSSAAGPRMHLVGEGDIILPFSAMGVVLHPVTGAKEADAVLREIAAAEPNALIACTGAVAEACRATVKELRDERAMVLCVLPVGKAEEERHLAEMRALVARAVRMDMIGKAMGGQT